MFSCEYLEIFKNNYFEEHLRTAASLKKREMLSKCHNSLYKSLENVCPETYLDSSLKSVMELPCKNS